MNMIILMESYLLIKFNIKKRMIKGKLNDVTKGITPTDYRIKHFK